MSRRGGFVLPAVVLLLAITAVLASALAELAGSQALLARNRAAAAVALAAADACVARVVAALPAGWDASAALVGPDGVAGTADDGTLDAPAGCVATAAPAPGPALPARALVTVVAEAGGGRRVVEADVRRRDLAGADALVWLDDGAVLGDVGGALVLDGTDLDLPALPPAAALAAPLDPAILDGWLAATGGHVTATASAPRVAPAAPVAALATRLAAAGAAPAVVTLVATAPAPEARTLVASDLAVTGPLAGAGLLVVTGRLDIDAPFHFNGVVVAGGGIRVGTAGNLRVDGAVWLGRPLAGAPALVVDGSARIGARNAAVAMADALFPLPRLAVVRHARDAG